MKNEIPLRRLHIKVLSTHFDLPNGAQGGEILNLFKKVRNDFAGNKMVKNASLDLLLRFAL